MAAHFLGHANVRHARHILRSQGFRFCEDDEERAHELRDLYEPLEPTWRREASCYRYLIQRPVLASTTDHVSQSIVHTLGDDRHFWSSGPSTTIAATESLVYQLIAPLCVVKFVSLAVYREFHQAGSPLYPPLELSIGIGTTPTNISTVTPRYPVPLDDGHHLYPVPASAAPGMFLRLEFHGKQQLQREDMQYYIAIRYVSAVGEALPTPEAVAAVKQLLSTRQCMLPLLQGPRVADVQHELDSGAMLAAAQQDQQPGTSATWTDGDPAARPTYDLLQSLQRLRSVIGTYAGSRLRAGTAAPAASAGAADASASGAASQQLPTRSTTDGTPAASSGSAAIGPSGEDGLPMTGPGMVVRWGLPAPAMACRWEVDKGHEQWQYDEDWDGLLAA